MRKLLVSLLAIAIAGSSLFAQTVEFIEPRNVQGVPEAEFSTYKVGDNFYVLQKKYRMMAPVMYDLQLDAYDANRKPIGSNTIDKTLEMGDANIYEGVFAMKDKLVMFKSEFSKASGAKMSYLYYYPFDVSGKRQKKMSLTSFVAESAFNSGNFSVNVSPDGTKVVVISELPYEKDGMEKCIITVYDENFKQLWKKDYTFMYESSKAPKNTIFVNNNGVAFLLKQINLKKAFDQFSMFTFAGDGKAVVEKKIDLGNGFVIATHKELFKANGDMLLAGYSYMNKKVGVNVETPDGVFYLDVNASNGELNAAKLNAVKPSLVVATQLLALPDNTVCLVGEHRFIGSTSVPGKPMEYTYSYSYGKIHFTKFAADGSQSWNYTVDKDLKSVSDGGRFVSSYSWVNGGDINVLFADELSWHDEKKQFIEFGSKRINLIQVIDANGKFKSEIFIKDPRIGGKKGEYFFIPTTGNVYKNNQLFMLAARGLELVGAAITF
ncbi:MAG: hypothetical protein IPJ29_10000 [Chitinophagaceae bacterium]|nr:hypothetical protein [Chitinophagaceae bacterium]